MKNNYCRIIILTMVIPLWVLALPNQAVAQNYNITDLGSLIQGGNSEATGINDLGEVVGSSDTAGCEPNPDFCNAQPHAFFWTKERGMIDLGTLGGERSYAYGINNSSQVVGSSLTAANLLVPFLWTESQGMNNLGNLDLGDPGQVKGKATGINDGGQVTGYSYLDYGIYNAFLWTEEGMKNLNTLEQNFCVAMGINDYGQVTGYMHMTPSSSSAHAFLLENGTFNDLNTLGGSESLAYHINNSGQVVGGSVSTSGNVHAFLWENDVMTDLGTLGGYRSEAKGINESGQVVGFSEFSTSSYDTRAFLWESAKGMIDLNDLIPAGSGWNLTRANAINKNGQIVGVGRIDLNGDGEFDALHAFLLTPITEPIPVGIDIRPHAHQNIMNQLSKGGMVRVAILSTADFSAPDMVDRNSLTFGHSGNENSLAFCKSRPKDINHDRLKDLVCYFRTPFAGFQCGDTEGILKGKTVEGIPIEGRDAVRIVPCPKPKSYGRR